MSTSHLLDRSLRVHPQVAVRPEAFGALLYHFGTRRLSFLKDPRLLAVVQGLDAAPDARTACREAGLTDAQLPAYEKALGTLVDTEMLLENA